MEYMILGSGKKVHFMDEYSYGGVHISVVEKTNDEERKEIEQRLRQSRDLLSVTFA